ncbi:hypothetical protein CS022_20010 [Veronia nyctiphanis]|uniref:Uncharacterized protein n=2 Tax=Veronia nyctiphanis TaxID=1278244 RepID=A0A4Q0YMY1_9GAMM|nr:hypothetical protein CS022_20010 [Veronia nyctiphanis]
MAIFTFLLWNTDPFFYAPEVMRHIEVQHQAIPDEKQTLTLESHSVVQKYQAKGTESGQASDVIQAEASNNTLPNSHTIALNPFSFTGETSGEISLDLGYLTTLAVGNHVSFPFLGQNLTLKVIEAEQLTDDTKTITMANTATDSVLELIAIEDATATYLLLRNKTHRIDVVLDANGVGRFILPQHKKKQAGVKQGLTPMSDFDSMLLAFGIPRVLGGNLRD